MNFLLDILMEIIGRLLPGQRNHDDRSIVGESKMDRSARLWTIVGLIVLVLIGASVWAWWRYL